MSNNGTEFFQTRMGERFYESTMRRIAKALEEIAKELHIQNDAYNEEEIFDDEQE